ncbi:MAG: hypothetical protein ACM3ZE_16650, partial [Myxococcales bacterium]
MRGRLWTWMLSYRWRWLIWMSALPSCASQETTNHVSEGAGGNSNANTAVGVRSSGGASGAEVNRNASADASGGKLNSKGSTANS